MKPAKLLFPLIFIGLSFTSCMMNSQVKTLQIEILKPAIFNIPKELSVAVINRDLFKSDTCIFYYSNGNFKAKDTIPESISSIDSVHISAPKYYLRFETLKDTTIKYAALSDSCTDALVKYCIGEGYFREIKKVSDSLKNVLNQPGQIKSPDELFDRTKSDVIVFLDFLNLNTIYNKSNYNHFPFTSKASLLWTVAFKSDSIVYTYNQVDTLFYDRDQLNSYNNKDRILGQLVNSSCTYLGRSFGARLIPTWMPAERMYYKSKNPEMLKAENFAISQDWLSAAEIWNKQTKNKNKKIAAKACYNMALTCEMEGKPDVAIAWLVQSFSCMRKNDEYHKYNCQHYVNVLALRKLEIERLKKSSEYSGLE